VSGVMAGTDVALGMVSSILLPNRNGVGRGIQLARADSKSPAPSLPSRTRQTAMMKNSVALHSSTISGSILNQPII